MKTSSIFIYLIFGLFSSGLIGQECDPNTNHGGGWTAHPTPGNNTTYTVGLHENEFAVLSGVQAGSTYKLHNTNANYCLNMEDYHFVIRYASSQSSPNGDGSVVAFGPLPLSWVAPFNGKYVIHIYKLDNNGNCIYPSWTENCSSLKVLNCGPSDDCDLWNLPVELTSLTAVPDNNIIKMAWTTKSELNNDYFTVLRSENGKHWEEISQVDGAGNSNERIDYQYIDRNIIDAEISYYKLRQTDYNGQFEEFGPVSVRHSSGMDVFVMSNPVKNILSINQKTDFKIFDLTGKEVEVVDLSPVSFDVSNLNAGVYILRFENGDIVKLVKE
nr:T9SS type A sorting domain-containing protein [uncultured Brumimicrobium sp.]